MVYFTFFKRNISASNPTARSLLQTEEYVFKAVVCKKYKNFA